MNGSAAAWVPQGFAYPHPQQMDGYAYHPSGYGTMPPMHQGAYGTAGMMPMDPNMKLAMEHGMEMNGAAGMMPMDGPPMEHGMEMGGGPEWHHHSGMDGSAGAGEWQGGHDPAALSGRIVDLAFSKTGSMALQADLVSTLVDERTGALATITNTEHVAKILSELEGVMDKVMQDRYGSHLARALVKVCSVQQRIDMWRSLQGPTLIGTACSHFGKWVVQRMIESAAAESAAVAAAAGQPGAEDTAAMSREEMVTLQQALCNNHTDGVLSLCFDPNGSTVMKACVVSMPVSRIYLLRPRFEYAGTSASDSANLPRVFADAGG